MGGEFKTTTEILHFVQNDGGGVNDGARTGGLMVYATTYSQDGASANNREFGGSAGLQGLESIGEVRIETSTGNAKSSTPASVIITTRGGTNAFGTRDCASSDG